MKDAQSVPPREWAHDGKGTAFMDCRRPEELCPGGDRASVVAKKRGNARGVKGGRKVEA